MNKNIGLCYLPVEFARSGLAIQVIVRGQPADAMTVETLFTSERNDHVSGKLQIYEGTRNGSWWKAA